ncbi:MAG TPA: hypothetical protein VGT60_02505 [Candidatus Limnocylindria bacterium]|nr:hypothetical protein [Candidatus Limnocylindria bacterium]
MIDRRALGPASVCGIVPAVIVGVVLGLLTDAFARYIEFAPA